MGVWDSVTSGASSLWNSASSAVVDGVSSTANGIVGDVKHLGELGGSIYDVGVTGSNLLSGYVHSGERAVLDSVRADEDRVQRESHARAAYSKDIPILGSLAEGMADVETFAEQAKGGVIGGATTMAAGLANMVLHPLDTVAGLEGMLEHTSGPVGSTLRLGHGLYDAATGKGSLAEANDRAYNPAREAMENEKYWSGVGNGLIAPYKESFAQGRYGEILGRGAFDIGSLLLGTGEAKGAAVAGEIGEGSRVAEVGDAARAAEAGDAARAAEVGDAARAEQAQTKFMGDSQRNTIPLTPEEVARGKAKAVEFGMPEQKIKVDLEDPNALTSYGSMYDGAIEEMTIANDMKPATPHQLPDGSWAELTPNQRVSADGAIAHEVVGHRGADRAGMSKIDKDPFFYEGKPDVVTVPGSVKKTVEEGRVVEKVVEEQRYPAKDVAKQTDEAQASLRAAKLAPGLSNAERMVLFKDAMARLAKIGLGIDDVPGLGLHLK